VTVDDLKRAAAERAASLVEDGMVVGLGSGSTAAFAVAALAARVAAGLRIACIPTSERTAALARRLGLTLASFAEHRQTDLDIDGADAVVRGTLTLVKGRGGALLREKIVACASRRMVVTIDETKLVERLGPGTVVPVEIVPFGWETVLDRLVAAEAIPRLRRDGAAPFVTDGGHYIADCTFAAILDPAALELRLKSIVGVVECGLFVGLAALVCVGRPSSVEVIER
jgi:ribose 5-phosphate isomerase A